MGNDLSTLVDVLSQSSNKGRDLREWIQKQPHGRFKDIVKSEFGVSITFVGNAASSSTSAYNKKIQSKASRPKLKDQISDQEIQWKPSRDNLQGWISDIESFWKSASWSLDIRTSHDVDYNQRLIDLCERTAKSTVISGIVTIQSRYAQIFFYRILFAAHPLTSRGTTRTLITQSLCLEFLKRFLKEDPKPAVVDAFHDAALRGKAYQELETATCEGILAVAPGRVDTELRTTRGRRTPYKVKNAQEIIQTLQLEDYAREIGAPGFSEVLLASLLDAFRPRFEQVLPLDWESLTRRFFQRGTAQDNGPTVQSAEVQPGSIHSIRIESEAELSGEGCSGHPADEVTSHIRLRPNKRQRTGNSYNLDGQTTANVETIEKSNGDSSDEHSTHQDHDHERAHTSSSSDTSPTEIADGSQSTHAETTSVSSASLPPASESYAANDSGMTVEEARGEVRSGMDEAVIAQDVHNWWPERGTAALFTPVEQDANIPSAEQSILASNSPEIHIPSIADFEQHQNIIEQLAQYGDPVMAEQNGYELLRFYGDPITPERNIFDQL